MMDWSLRPERRAIKKINGLVEKRIKIKVLLTSYWFLVLSSAPWELRRKSRVDKTSFLIALVGSESSFSVKDFAYLV